MAQMYKVLGQSPDMELDSTNSRFVNGWVVSWEVTSGPAAGAQGKTFVPEAQHNATALDSLISAKVNDLTEIAQLGGK